MKKRLLALSILSTILLTGCGHEHTFSEANCTEPRTCIECGETEGEALKHTWIEASCESPKTCSVCGATEGTALEHTWQEATCTEPKTCSVCNATEGEPLEHKFIDATYDAPKTCELCGLTEGEPLEKIEEPPVVEEPQEFTDETPFEMTDDDRRLLLDLGATEEEINSVKTQGDLQKLLEVLFARSMSNSSGSGSSGGGSSSTGGDDGIEGNGNDLPIPPLNPDDGSHPGHM